MIVTITGGAGFIGSHLCQRFLSKKTKVICIDTFSSGNLIIVTVYTPVNKINVFGNYL